ncbi:MAG: hypothetical protein GY725_05935 [bacterium]|nr:hypothetical protein [bacterium]
MDPIEEHVEEGKDKNKVARTGRTSISHTSEQVECEEVAAAYINGGEPSE